MQRHGLQPEEDVSSVETVKSTVFWPVIYTHIFPPAVSKQNYFFVFVILLAGVCKQWYV